MTDKLPIVIKHRAVITSATPGNSLLGRGLAAIQRKETGITGAELDTRYRQARDIYNRASSHRCIIFIQTDLFENDLLQILADMFTTFQQLAAQGYGKAYFPLAKMYKGEEGISENIEKHFYYSRLAFDWCFTNRTLEDSEIWRDLGWMYYNGFGIEQDYKQAVFWYCKAAEHGDAAEQFNLGRMYKVGHNIDRDDEQAVFWWKKAAEKGDMDAQYSLGEMYEEGLGVKQNDEEAMFWYSEAAEQGHVDAQLNLGKMYEGGRGGGQDYEHAVFWYREAAEQGDEKAQENLKELGINWQEA